MLDRAGRASKKRVAAVVALWATVMGSLTLASGCFGHICDGDALIYGRLPMEGHLIDENTWESNAVGDDWLAFPKQRVYFLDLHELGDRVPFLVTPYVSAQQNPNKEGGNFTVAAGNLTEISGADKARVTLKNDTCADYFLRVVVEVPPRPSASATPTPAPTSALDAGSDAEAGP